MPRVFNPELGYFVDADTTDQIRKEDAREVKARMEPEMSLAMVPHPTVGVMPPEYTKETAKPKSWWGKAKDLFHTASRYITPELVLGIANAAHKTGYVKGNLANDALRAANFLKGVKNPGAQSLAGVVGAIPAVTGLFGKGKEVAAQVPSVVNTVKERYLGANGKGRAPMRVPGTSTAMVPYSPLASARASLGRVR